MLGAWLLIILGMIFLLQNLGIMPMIQWSIVWPVLLIVFGLYLLSKRSGCCGWWQGKKEEKK